MVRLTKAQRGLVALVRAGFSIRDITRAEAKAKDLLWAFEAVREAGLIRSAGYETTVAAEEWLESASARQALEAHHEQ